MRGFTPGTFARPVPFFLLCLLAAIVALPGAVDAQGDWRAALQAERAKNAERIEAIDARAQPLGDELNAVMGRIDVHNTNQPDPRNGSAVDAYNAEAEQLNARKQRLIEILTPLKEESDRLIARNKQIDLQLSCIQPPLPCESNADCRCSQNCGEFTGGTLGSTRVCQP